MLLFLMLLCLFVPLWFHVHKCGMGVQAHVDERHEELLERLKDIKYDTGPLLDELYKTNADIIRSDLLQQEAKEFAEDRKNEEKKISTETEKKD